MIAEKDELRKIHIYRRKMFVIHKIRHCILYTIYVLKKVQKVRLFALTCIQDETIMYLQQAEIRIFRLICATEYLEIKYRAFSAAYDLPEMREYRI